MNIKKFHLNCGTLRPYGFFPFKHHTALWKGKIFQERPGCDPLFVVGYRGRIDSGRHGLRHTRLYTAHLGVKIFNPVGRAFIEHEHTLRRLKIELGDKLLIFSAHDPNEYERLSGKTLN